MRRRVLLSCMSLIVLFSLAARADGQTSACATTVQRMPLIERPATSDTNSTLVVLLTGDGGWAGADEKVAEGLRERGAAIVGVNMRSYLSDRKTPNEAAADIGCVAEEYAKRWSRPRLMLLGYSRGADIAPFVASRWPASLTTKLNAVALVSLSTTANFQFHYIDLIRDVKRADDVPVAPELAKLVGVRVLCVYGTEEQGSGCHDADPSIVTSYPLGGGHRLTGGFAIMAHILEQGLRAPASPAVVR